MSGPVLIVVGLGVGCFVFMVVCIAILSTILLPALARAREAARRASCQNNLKQVGLVFIMHANEDPDGNWPQLSEESGKLMFRRADVYPEYLFDPTVLICPSDTETEDLERLPADQVPIDDHSYYYFGYVLTNEDEALAFLECYPGFVAEEADFSTDLPAPPGRGSFGGEMFLRLRTGVEDGTGVRPADVPVMFDATSGSPSQGFMMFNHVPGGANVLYMDGTVKFVRYPDDFPMTGAFLEALGKIDK